MSLRNAFPSRRSAFLAVTGVATAMMVAAPIDRADAREAALTIAVQARPSGPVRRAAPRRSNDDQDRDVRVHNQTGWTMTYLYASGGGGWSGDLLGSAVLDPGDTLVVAIDDGSGACRYSLRAEFDNGQSLERYGIEACEVADYYFTR